MKTNFMIELPKWFCRYLEEINKSFSSPQEKMKFVIGLSQRNIQEKTGGPFGAAVFEKNSGQLVSAGVNLVISSGLSIAHAEIVALSLAQKEISQYRLSNRQDCSYELFTSCQPCAMCLGAIPWSGVSSVVCGATEDDAAAAGFDEGHKPDAWQKGLQERGITVVCDVLKDAASQVLKGYGNSKGVIY